MEGARIPDVKPIGLTWDGDGFWPDQVERHQLRISQAATLQDLSEEYAWFTLALLYLRVPLGGRDPWHDYLQESRRPAAWQLTLHFDKPIFAGLEAGNDPAWNHVLWAMPKDEWEHYRKWVGRASFVDRDRRCVTWLREQQTTIADPLALAKVAVLPSPCPTTEVTVFWIDSNQGCAYLRSSKQSHLAPPRLITTSHAFADTRLMADAILAQHPNPFGVVERAAGVDPVHELAERVKQAREDA